MATIKLTDQFGLDTDVKLAPFSSLLKYFQQIPALQLSNIDLSKVAGLTLDQPALTVFNGGVSFNQSVPIGEEAISIFAGAHGSLELILRTPAVTYLEDVYSDFIEIAEGTCYFAFGIEASVGVSGGPEAGLLQFGVTPGANVDIKNFQRFPLKQGITLLDAVARTVGNFVIPAKTDDLASLPEGCIATVTGTGSLKFSATANLLAVTNPLAAVTLPAPLPELDVTAGGTASVGASFEISCTYQICARKLDAGHVRLGWYREKESEVAVNASVSEGVSAGFGGTDLFSTIVGVISPKAAADLDELQRAGLPSDQIEAIQDAVEAAVARKLEIALSTEITRSQDTDASFLYDLDLAALTAASRQAVDQALRGDLSGLQAGSLPGITVVQDVWGEAQKKGIQLHVNLLGILNFGSISKLTLSGSVLYEPATGALVITDKATAQRVQSTAVNFGAATDKLRHVMAESFLLTAVYKGSQQQVGGPALKSGHSFFDLNNNTNRDQMTRELRIGQAIGLLTAEQAAPPAGIDDFGRTMVHASTEYDDTLATALFLDSNGAPLPHEYYEEMGRNAVQLLVAEGDQDAIRRKPTIDNDLWAKMKSQGQPGFAQLFPGVSAPLLGAITADYSAIVWWADAMTGAGVRLQAIRQWFGQHPKAASDDPEFQKLRQDLADHLEKVTAKTSEQFGEPWGLLAMNEASGRRAGASILITGPKLVRSGERPLPK